MGDARIEAATRAARGRRARGVGFIRARRREDAGSRMEARWGARAGGGIGARAGTRGGEGGKSAGTARRTRARARENSRREEGERRRRAANDSCTDGAWSRFFAVNE